MKNINLQALFIKNLKLIRKEKNYTQEKLIELSGVIGVPDIECGRSMPNLNTMIKLADALDVEVWQLLYDWETCRPVSLESSEVELKYFIKQAIDKL